MYSQRLSVLMTMINKDLKGGPPGHLPYLVKGLKKSNIDVIEVGYGARRNKENVTQKILNTLGSLVNLIKIISSKKIDIIHFNSAFDRNSILRDFITIFFIRLWNIPIFMKTHGTNAQTLASQGLITTFVRKKLFSWVSVFGVLSNEERQNFINAGIDPSRVVRIKNIVNTALLKSNLEAFRREFDLQKSTPILLFSARFIPEKGLMDVLDACSLLRNKNYDFHLFCLGDGEEYQKALDFVLSKRLSNHVTFTGYIPEEDTKAFYASADILLFPTYHNEGFPMALFQSVAAGAGVVTTRIRAAADYLREPHNCLWVESQNPEMLSRKIEVLLTDSKLLGEMKAANISIGKEFSIKEVSEEFVTIYEAITGKSKMNKDFVKVLDRKIEKLNV